MFLINYFEICKLETNYEKINTRAIEWCQQLNLF